MKTRLTTIKDYPELVTWWNAKQFPPPTIQMLPNNLKDGIMVSCQGENVCAGFLYRTTSNLAWCEFIVASNKVKDKKIRKNALSLLINTISELAKKLGFELLFTSLNHEKLIQHYLDCGYIKGDTSIEMIKIL